MQVTLPKVFWDMMTVEHTHKTQGWPLIPREHIEGIFKEGGALGVAQWLSQGDYCKECGAPPGRNCYSVLCSTRLSIGYAVAAWYRAEKE